MTKKTTVNNLSLIDLHDSVNGYLAKIHYFTNLIPGTEVCSSSHSIVQMLAKPIRPPYMHLSSTKKNRAARLEPLASLSASRLGSKTFFWMLFRPHENAFRSTFLRQGPAEVEVLSQKELIPSC